MWLKQTSDWMEGVGFSLTRAVNGVGVFFLAVMMMVTAVDVIGRFVFNLPVKGSIEITGFLLVFTIFLAIAYAQSREQHITIDILVSRFPDRARLIINTIILLIGLIILAVFA